MNRAKRFIKHCQAEWVVPSVVIRFVRAPDDHRDRSDWYQRAVNEGIATISELANTPVARPSMLLRLGKRKGATRHVFLAAQGA